MAIFSLVLETRLYLYASFPFASSSFAASKIQDL